MAGMIKTEQHIMAEIEGGDLSPHPAIICCSVFIVIVKPRFHYTFNDFRY